MKLRKILRFLGLSLLFGFALILAILLNLVFSTPKVAFEELPPNLISLESNLGQKLLAQSNFRQDFPVLQENFVSQSRRAFCGVASSVILVNSLHKPQSLAQNSLFGRKARQVIHPLKVTFMGMTLVQLNGILQANQLNTKPYYADRLELEQFRSLAQDNLNNPNDFIVVNYLRTALGQAGGGHISPIAAYHQESDRFLIMDVAAYKYPPTWVRSEQLWAGMKAIDSVADRSRGFIVATK